MKKEITIRPVNVDISLVAEAILLKNEFLSKGFKTVGAFQSIMQHLLDQYKPDSELKRLDAWWRLRLKDEQVNKDVEHVLERLKNE